MTLGLLRSPRVSRSFSYTRLFFQTTVGCIDPTVNDRKTHGNFYRLAHSVVKEEMAKVTFWKMMNWTRVSIISDTSQFTYQATSFLAEYAYSQNITLVAEAFFTDDPSHAIDLLVAVDARIIVANCYINTCPKVACEAYKKGLYGPTIVWSFSGGVDLRQKGLPRPEGCTFEMTNEIAKSSMEIGVDMHGIIDPTRKSQFGRTIDDLTRYVLSANPDSVTRAGFHWKDICYELMMSTGFILDTAEKTLQSSIPKTSLWNLLGDRAKSGQVVELLRTAVLNLEYNSSVGISKKSSKSTDEEYIHGLPLLTISQYQLEHGELVRKLVAWFDDDDGLHYRDQPYWATDDGKAPLDSLLVERHLEAISSSSINLIFAISGIFIAIILATMVLMFVRRNNEKYINNF